jgi:hypothetical protein
VQLFYSWVSLFEFIRIAGYHLSQNCELLDQSKFPLVREITSINSSRAVRKDYCVVWQHCSGGYVGHLRNGAVLEIVSFLFMKLA